MNCKYLSKKLNGSFKCLKHKSNIISLLTCKNCPELILKRNKGINKVSKKRIFVTKETYQKVFERDKGVCRLCGSNQIQLHHILYRSEAKNLINDPNNCIMLCNKHHRLVHSNKDKYQQILKEIIKNEM